MTQRREFIKQAGLLAGLYLADRSTQILTTSSRYPIGLQLFTLFNVIDEDVQGALKKVADIGFKEIESAFSKKGGYYGMQPREFRNLVRSLGMTWRSHHVLGAPFKFPPGTKMPTAPDGKPIEIPPMRNLRENYKELVREAAEGGVKYLVCASTPIETLDEIRTSIETLNRTAEECRRAGITLAYHNHDREFMEVEGEQPYHLILSQTDPGIKMELDLAWVTKAGFDPVDLIRQNPGRFPMWHVKDLSSDFNTILPVGTGSIEFKRIFDQAKLSGLKYIFIEHDMPADPFASITTSYANVTKLLAK